ncbi:MAG: iron-sulfur cluster carrier protein ApbC [Cardiobacteriaceae bacterium]|nr:iron-sulfur cluster carrier protein ApbC [Cardiobacteriaceae bacterium]
MNITHLQNYHDPILDITPFSHKNAIHENDDGSITLSPGFPASSEETRWREALQSLGIDSSKLRFDYSITAHNVQSGLKPYPGVKNIIAVASGKGGVGKSTLSVNLALALQQLGAATGLLDADIYGPSQARMLGGATRPTSTDGKTMQPILRHGLQTLSLGDLVDEDTAMIWRGPMVTQTLLQLFRETRWQDLDYLIIDLPPGTGDTQLTLSQQIPVAGAVIITTPQDIALLDAKKAKTMFDKVHVPILGLVENMSVYICPNCGHEAHIFGKDGGKLLAVSHQLPYLGDIPLDIGIREETDGGKPTVITAPDSDIARRYRLIALKTTAQLAAKQKNFTQAFPKIVIER